MISMSEARKLLLEMLPPGTEVISSTKHDEDYLFIVDSPDPLEGNLDPFFKVNYITKEILDFSPMEYPDPQSILKKLGF